MAAALRIHDLRDDLTWVAKAASRLRVCLPALSIHLKVALHSGGHPVPVPGVHPHAVITPSHCFQGCGARGRNVRAAPGRRRWPPYRGSPGLWGDILPLQSRRRSRRTPLSRTIATPAAGSWTGVEAKGDAEVVGLLWSRGQRWRSGLVRVMRCSENMDSLQGLSCTLPRPALTPPQP